MRFVNAQEIDGALTLPALVAAMETAHTRARIEIEDGFLGSEGAHYFVRHAVDRGRLMGSKLITSFPGNLGGDLPAVQSVRGVRRDERAPARRARRNRTHDLAHCR